MEKKASLVTTLRMMALAAMVAAVSANITVSKELDFGSWKAEKTSIIRAQTEPSFVLNVSVVNEDTRAVVDGATVAVTFDTDDEPVSHTVRSYTGVHGQAMLTFPVSRLRIPSATLQASAPGFMSVEHLVALWKLRRKSEGSVTHVQDIQIGLIKGQEVIERIVYI